MSDFESLNLHPSINIALTVKGYETPTPIQAMAIPPLMEGKDLLGIAQTGTGKTAAFALPIINELAKRKERTKPNHVRALILTPTRELASQINESLEDYGQGLGLSSAVIFGGVGKTPQMRNLKKGIDILVATPGRLLDLMSEGLVKYEQLEVFVLDEADRMLDMGFIRDIQKIIAKLPKERQTLLFSATMPNDIAKLANSLLKNPVKVEITPQATTVEKIDQKIHMVNKGDKSSLLESILEDGKIESVLVFTRTKHGADRVVKKLQRSEISSAAIHGNKSQGAREKALGSFRAGEIRVLVATDIAARGIDIPQVSHVINFDLPEDAENYVHRIGRTGRAGRNGVSVSFCDEAEVKLLRSIERFIKLKVPVDTNHPFHGLPARPSEQQVPVHTRPNNRNPRSGGGGGRRRFR